ncbi:Protein N-acetyltransferase, RimJ/RimL family [Palleronia salina]|uniref:Protein N-acetyltransferase, RimJ/RimL family n=1 Tax=Palleronia salina TaxID=313368 RepID=A0A1M6LEJ7_9RHOB|nr:GNAT family protein [Palleronia salina]SHJ69596.1 Protein N-acetyltransferase, RimJ/RimL family [Palleronia salina]
MGPLAGWRPPQLPSRVALDGRYVRLEPFAPGHESGLFDAFAEDAGGAMWQYLPVGPFASVDDYLPWFDAARTTHDPLHFAVRGEDGRLGGSLSLLRIDPCAGSVETGWLTFAPRLQRTRAASEAVILLARWAFGAGYRRFEWKCNAANMASRRAAQRFGFGFEGVFRQAGVVKGANRDTAWFAITDGDAATLDKAWSTWLDPANFDADGRQKQRFSDLTRPCLAAIDPALG